MSAPASPPAKIGAKIDFIAKLLGERLKPHGFVRKSRLMHRTVGDGLEACHQSIELQGDRWNAGATGRFTVNLGVLFPAIEAAAAAGHRTANSAYMPDDLRPAFATARIFGRLGDIVPKSTEPGWPSGLAQGADYWASVDLDTDLAELGHAIGAVLLEHALPWFAQRARLREACLMDRGLRPRDAIIGLLLIGEDAAAREMLCKSPPHRLAMHAEDWRRYVETLQGLGLTGEMPSWQEPAAHPMKARRAAEVAQRIEKHEAAIHQYLARAGSDWTGDIDALLDAWIHAAALDPMRDEWKGGQLWELVAKAPVPARRQLAVRAIERCAGDGPTVESTAENVWATYRDFHLSAFPALVVQLLDIDELEADPTHVQALARVLAMSASKVSEDLMTDSLRAPLPAVVRWIARRASAACRYECRTGFQALVDELGRLAIERYLERTRTPPSADLLGPELADQLAEAFTPEARERVAAVYREFPERAYGTDDREAIIQLRRWTRAEPDGRIPLLIENDDWGKSVTEALRVAPLSLNAALSSLLEWFDSGVETRPSKRWVSDLERRLADIDRESLIDWLAATLPRFADTRLEHAMGTPGIGTFPGSTSGRVALGLVHAAAILDSPRLVEPLATMVEAALMVVPGQRMRAQGLATAAFAPIARSPDGRAKLQALMRKVKQKPVIAAMRKAIEEAAG